MDFSIDNWFLANIYIYIYRFDKKIAENETLNRFRYKNLKM